MHRRLAVFFALACWALLSSCGAEHERPLPKQATSSFETPESLLDRIAELSGGRAVPPSDLVALVQPSEQQAIAFVVTVLPLMLGSANLLIAARKENREVQSPLTGEIDDMLKRHGLDNNSEKFQEMLRRMRGKQTQGSVSSETALEVYGDTMRGVDRRALTRDAWPLLQRMAEATKATPQGTVQTQLFSRYTRAWIANARSGLKVEGDSAVLTWAGAKDVSLVLVKADDGLWYISAAKSNLLDT